MVNKSDKITEIDFFLRQCLDCNIAAHLVFFSATSAIRSYLSIDQNVSTFDWPTPAYHDYGIRPTTCVLLEIPFACDYTNQESAVPLHSETKQQKLNPKKEQQDYETNV